MSRLRTILARQKKAGPQIWHACPRCGNGYRIQGGNSCFCIWDPSAAGGAGSWMGVPLVPVKDQEAAEAAYRIGGSQAVGELLAQEPEHGR